ncbi:MAG: NAD-dependent DNA ligase LigA [Lachnospiraceae bacterium]|nr:NAD-dependent DNA ligase LigA [Lachnospiraceae bacterium]
MKQAEYLELVQTIEAHNDRYYIQDSPVISDYEYDQLMLKLKEIESTHPEWVVDQSPTKHVGAIMKRKAGVLIAHEVPMLSLQDVFSKEEVYAFVESMKTTLHQPEFVVERKIDGLSMAIRYENGKLKQAITRGDGVAYGEDVTENAKVIQGMVLSFQPPIEKLEVRGEVYMTEDSFEKVNQKQEAEGKKIFANPRNCAAGTLRQLDANVTKERGLNHFIFNIQQINGAYPETHTEGYDLLKQWGFPIIEQYVLCHSAKEVWDAICEIGEERGQFGYPIDGAVVKINSYEQRLQLGETSKVPRWAIAFKYPPEEKETILLDVDVSVGRTGRITPTAVFEPVRLCGTTVSRATLHNQDFIDELDIRIGDTLVVYKSGEIIPKIKGVVKEKRNANSEPYQLPQYCPVCHSKTIRLPDSADLKCVSADCPAQLEQHLINFVGRDAMDIKGFGSSYIEVLIREGYIKNIVDIYRLFGFREELVEKGLIGKEKNTDKLLSMIELSKDNEPYRLVTGLGIPNVGKATAKSLMNVFHNLRKLSEASMEELQQVQDVGEVSAVAIYQFFQEEHTKDMIQNLEELGLNFVQKEEKSQGFDQVTFVITGTFQTMERKNIQEVIEQLGGKVASAVSKKTNYLIAGEQAGSKLSKAQELGVQILDETEFIELLEKTKTL